MAGLSVTLRGNFAKLDELKSKSEKTASSVKQAFSGLNKALSFAGLTIGASAAFAAVAAGAKSAVMAASNLGETVSKTQAVFKGSSAEMIAWAEKASRTFGQSKQQALDAASGFGNLFVSMGIGEGKAAGMSQRITELASDLASFNNTTVDEAIEAIGAGLRGEAEPMRRFGVLMDDATLKAQAFAMGIWDGKGSLEPTTRALAAYELILAKTTTAQGDFQRTGDGLANSQRTLSALTQDLMADIGEGLLPVVQQFANDLKAMDFKSVADSIGTLTSGVMGLASAFTSVIESLMKMSGLLWVIEKAGEYLPSQTVATNKASLERAANETDLRYLMNPGEAFPIMELTGAKEAIQQKADSLKETPKKAKPPVKTEGEAGKTLPKTEAPPKQTAKTLKEVEEEEKRRKSKAKAASDAESAFKKIFALQEEYQLEAQILAAQTIGDAKRLEALEREKKIREEMKRLESAGISENSTRAWAEELVSAQETADKSKSKREAITAYDEEYALLTARMTGDEKRIAIAEREKEIREETKKLMDAGFTAEEARTPAEKMVKGKMKADMADKLSSLQFQSTIGAVSSLARVGGGGGVTSSGLDYARQQSDLIRDTNDILREILRVSKPSEL